MRLHGQYRVLYTCIMDDGEVSFLDNGMMCAVESTFIDHLNLASFSFLGRASQYSDGGALQLRAGLNGSLNTQSSSHP